MLHSRTPIPHDPGYEPACAYYRPVESPPPPRGRVRPEAQHIAKLHTSGSIGMLLEHHRVPDEQKTWVGPKKKDFSRQNIRHLRKLQLDTKRKKEECERPAVRTSCSKYDHIPAKVTAYLESHAHSPSPRETTPEADGSGHCAMQDRPISEEQRGKNFLADNIRQVAQHATKQPPASKELQCVRDRRDRRLARHQKGEVPTYLKERQNQWKQEEEERLAKLPDPSIPPGHTLMPTDERLKTLKILREHQETLIRELQSLPIRTDTLRSQTRRGQLETKLVEIEDAIKIFSRPKVFIKMDD